MRANIKGFANILKKKAIFSSLILLIFLTVLCTTASFAWLFTLKDVDPDLSFTAGSPEEYLLYQITCEDDSSVPDVTEVDSLGKSDFFADDLQFGKIQNLAMLENSNFIYYCVRIPKTDGQTVSVGVSYYAINGSHFKIYVPQKDGNGEPIYENGVLSTSLFEDQAVLAKIKEIEEVNSDTFIKYRAALSGIVPGEISSVDALDAMFSEEAKDLKPDEDGNLIYTSMTYDTSSLASDYYYLYIKLEPNVLIYPDFIEYLWENMPFGLCYNLRICFSVMP